MHSSHFLTHRFALASSQFDELRVLSTQPLSLLGQENLGHRLIELGAELARLGEMSEAADSPATAQCGREAAA